MDQWCHAGRVPEQSQWPQKTAPGSGDGALAVLWIERLGLLGLLERLGLLGAAASPSQGRGLSSGAVQLNWTVTGTRPLPLWASGASGPGQP